MRARRSRPARVRRSRTAVWLTPFALLSAAPGCAQTRDVSTLVASLDSAAAAHVERAVVPGVSVSVVHRGETLLQRGYGFVDLEWGTATPADGDAIYEIGSVTKQFTAAAIMLLVEEGRLDLDTDFTRYIEYDARGRTVPLRRLLDHTSGIKGYTEMSEFGQLIPFKLPRDSLVRVFEAEPFEFEPGTALIYNNSAYFLLGLIIEAVSGQPYEEFVSERLFGPAGMTSSHYCSESTVRERRAHGYDATGPDALVRAGYLDHTWPYAAGSLCSTVSDLAAWNRALHGGALLSDASYRALITPAPLVDGTPLRYAMGLGIDQRGDRRVIAHGGGINGFLSQLAWYPDEDLTVVVLQNSTGPPGPGLLATDLANLVLGPLIEPEPGTFTGDLDELAGRYSGAARGRTMDLRVSATDGRLVVADGNNEVTPSYRDGLRWVNGGTEYVFVRRSGRVAELRVDHIGGHYVLRRIPE